MVQSVIEDLKYIDSLSLLYEQKVTNFLSIHLLLYPTSYVESDSAPSL